VLLLNDVLQIPVFAVPNGRCAVLGLAAAVGSVAWCNCGGGSFEACWYSGSRNLGRQTAAIALGLLPFLPALQGGQLAAFGCG